MNKLNIFNNKIKAIRSVFNGDLAIEIMNYYPTGSYELVCEPGVIKEIVEDYNIDLLLDIGHMKVSCGNLGISTRSYLEALPLDRVKHIHLSRPAFLKKKSLNADLKHSFKSYLRKLPEHIWYDAHEHPVSSDMKLAIQILEKSKVKNKFITIEYYKNSEKLLEGCKQLRNLLTSKKK